MPVRFTAARYDEIATILGYRFKDRELLRNALTHSSSKRKRADYERLEFLGDRVLGLVLAEYLFRRNPGQREGHMSARHSILVKGETCAAVGKALALKDHLVMGRNEMSKGLNLNPTVLGDVVEALIAAIYLDGGIDAAHGFVLRNWEPFLTSPATSLKDAKTYLQEWALARSLPIPAYGVVGREGPEHAPIFSVEVKVGSYDPMRAEGPNKRIAEQEAARQFLRRENIRA